MSFLCNLIALIKSPEGWEIVCWKGVPSKPAGLYTHSLWGCPLWVRQKECREPWGKQSSLSLPAGKELDHSWKLPAGSPACVTFLCFQILAFQLSPGRSVNTTTLSNQAGKDFTFPSLTIKFVFNISAPSVLRNGISENQRFPSCTALSVCPVMGIILHYPGTYPSWIS